MKWDTERKFINAGFAIALLIIGILSFSLYRLFKYNNEDERMVKHTHLVLETSKELLSNLKDAETGQRGYIITGTEEFLEPFYMSIERNQHLLNTLRQLTADNPDQQRRIAEAETLIEEKFRISKESISARRQEGLAPAVEMIRSAEGKRVMDQLRVIFRDIESEEQQLLKIRGAEADNTAKFTKNLLLAGILISVSLFLLVFYVLQQQIRRRIRKEKELQESHEWFSKTLFSIGDAVVAIDTNFVVTYMNPVAEKLTGWAGESAMGKPLDAVFTAIHAVTRQKVENPAITAIHKKRVIAPQMPPLLVKKDKTELYVDTSGSPILSSSGEVIGSVLIFRDITEEKQISDKVASLNAELEQKVLLKTNELIRNENRLKLTLDNMLEGAQILGYDWRYIYVNNTVVEQSKHTREELLNSTLLEQYPGIENSALFRTLKTCMKDRVSKQFENEFTFADNSKGWFKLTVQPIPEGLFILSINIDERKKAELERKEYINALEEMLFMTSHKVRQPVSQIMGISNMLDTPVTTQEDLHKLVSYMKQSVTSLDTVTQELTTFIYELKQKSEK